MSPPARRSSWMSTPQYSNLTSHLPLSPPVLPQNKSSRMLSHHHITSQTGQLSQLRLWLELTGAAGRLFLKQRGDIIPKEAQPQPYQYKHQHQVPLTRLILLPNLLLVESSYILSPYEFYLLIRLTYQSDGFGTEIINAGSKSTDRMADK
jgi:hypothetical protein